MPVNRWRITWSDIIPSEGMKTVTFQTGHQQAFMLIDQQRWCPPCNRMCNRFGFANIGPCGPLGELALDPSDDPLWLP